MVVVLFIEAILAANNDEADDETVELGGKRPARANWESKR